VFGQQIQGFDREDAVLIGLSRAAPLAGSHHARRGPLQSLNVRGLCPRGAKAPVMRVELCHRPEYCTARPAPWRGILAAEIRRQFQEAASEEIPRGAGTPPGGG
jgi:hypothetical protein